MKFEFKALRRNVPDSELIEDVQRCAKKIKRDTITLAEYAFHPTTLTRRFRSWFRVLETAGLGASRSKFNISEEELFQNLESVWISLERQPRYNEILSPISKSSVGTYENRFGTWNHALEAFIGWVNQGQNDPGEKNEENITKTQNKPQKRSTKRDISERLRFSILLRDGFRCLSCGRSPLKSPGIELHVDHVITWSEVGETFLKNLQTKCSVCNLGKGNAFRE